MIGRRPDLDELDREIRAHIEAETADLIAGGMSADDARALAIRTFGNVALVKEDVRAVWTPEWLDALGQDIRDAVRQIRRNPAMAAVLVPTLALGIGLTTAIFSVVNAVLIRPLAFPHAERMVWVTTAPTDDRGAQAVTPASLAREILNSIDFGEWQAQATSFAHMVAYSYSDATLIAAEEASRVRILSASDGFWTVTGAEPLLGMLPEAKDRQILALTHRAYREKFHSDPAIIGRAVTIDGRQATIGAVLREDFAPQLPAPAWRPGLDQADIDAYRGMEVPPPPKVITPTTAVQLYLAIAELKPGVPVEQARAELETIHTREQREHPTPFGKANAIVMPLGERLVGPSRFALELLLAAAIVVLLITCANVANLLMSRSAARQKEIALRMSVGGGQWRLVRQLLVESLTYAVLGGVAGLFLASWLVDVVIGLMGPAVPRLTETTLDVRAMSFAMAAAAVTAVLFGLGPALSACRINVLEVLKEDGRSVTASKRALITGRAMVALQVSLTIVLLAGAGLLFKSVWRMTSFPAGFEPDRILTLRVDFRGPQYREQRARIDYATALLAKARTLPEVRDAAITTGRDSMMLVMKEGSPPLEDRAAHESPVSSVSARFGPMLGMSLVDGRWFADEELPGALMVNEALARREFPDGRAVGHRIRAPWVNNNGLGTIVGVVSNLKYAQIDADITPEVFFHYSSTPLFGVTIALQIDGDPVAAAPALTKALAAVDPTQSLFSVRTMEAALAESIAPRRFNLLLLGLFALTAVVLASLGVYGVVAYAVTERRHEIGIRLALGAERRRVVGMMLVQAMSSVAAGLVAGLLIALGGARLIAGLLYEVNPRDAGTLVATTALLLTVAFIACTLPALRAAAVDPAAALRAE